MKAIRVHDVGGPEVLQLDEIDLAPPGPGEAQVRHTAIGLNFLDCYYRSGLYPSPSGYPLIPGSEAAGVVVAVGDSVETVRPGDRVAYVVSPGSYAERRNVAADRLVKVPDGISDEVAAAMMLKGMTAQYLLRRTFKVEPGSVILFHAAAGGVGQIAGQWAKHLGATVIGTAGGPEKCAVARALGYDHVIDYRAADFVAEVKAHTHGAGVDVVYDSIGNDTFPGSLDCLKPFGTWVSFGNASGPVPPFALTALKGSLYATRPTLFAYIRERADLEACAADLFDVVLRGVVTVDIGARYALADAAQAHRDLEARRTVGSSILLP